VIGGEQSAADLCFATLEKARPFSKKEYVTEECLFCRIQQGLIPIAGGPIYEDELIYAHHFHTDEWPAYLGHLLVETKRHTPDFAALTVSESQAIGLLIAHLSKALKVCVGAEKIYVTFYGEATPHLHIHLTARYPNAPARYLRWNIEDWPDAPKGSGDDIAALSERLRLFLRHHPAENP